MLRIAHLTDHHFPYVVPKFINLSFEALKLFKPHVLVLGGDLIDAPGISPYLRPIEMLSGLQDDIDQCVSYLTALRHTVGSRTKIVFTLGNHEERLEKYKAREAPALSSLRDLTFEHLFKLPELNIIPYAPGTAFACGPLRFTHGTLIRKWSGNSAKALIEREGGNIVVGHSHRLGCTTIRQGPHILRGFESGCFCDPHPHYSRHTEDWHAGFSLFLIDDFFHQHAPFLWIPIWLDQKNILTGLRRILNGKNP